MSNGYLTTHVLDIYNGCPGKGIKGSIFIIENQKSHKIKDFKFRPNVIEGLKFLRDKDYYVFIISVLILGLGQSFSALL